MKYGSMVGVGFVAALLVACSGGTRSSGYDTESNGTDPSGSDTGKDAGTSGSTPPPGFGEGTVDAGKVGAACQYTDSTDHDGDGFSFADGDCNDCDPNANPGAYDVPGNGADEDCSGTPDDEPTNCDVGLAVASATGMDGAKAIGLCRTTTEGATGKAKTWGVISANYVLPDGTTSTSSQFAKGHGLLASLGVNNPQDGKAMLALSSGNAQGNDPSLDKGYTCKAPAGYPKPSPACPGVTSGTPHDGAALELTIRVPTNAKSFAYEENFFPYECPTYICSEYNDFFVAMMTPQVAGLPDGNIAFDSAGNPISVNNGLLQVCTAQKAGGKNFTCTLGASTLSGTGFEGHAATGWLQTTAPATPGSEITLRFAIWDSGDGELDSTVLIDKWTWSAASAMPGTQPAPGPK